MNMEHKAKLARNERNMIEGCVLGELVILQTVGLVIKSGTLGWFEQVKCKDNATWSSSV